MYLGLEQNYAQKLLQLAEDKSKCKIWSVLIFEIISSGKEDEVRPTFASTPNIALYGVRLIPEW
jgi:F0F1-type ATP synthase delta subunit